MNREWLALSRQYQAALQMHLQQGLKSRTKPAHLLGQQAARLGFVRMDLVGIHKTALKALMPAGDSVAAKARMVKRAGMFCAEAIIPIEKSHCPGMESASHFHNPRSKTLTRRASQLAAANLLKQKIVQRKAAEETLPKIEGDHAKLLKELRHLNHQILSAQENERKKISGELHDETAQTLVGINVRLLALKREAMLDTKRFKTDIASTQRLVNQSAKTLLRVARELGVRHKS